jgi:sialate O-acetylesterase
VYVSVDAFVNNAALIGVPTSASGEFYQMDLSSMNVDSDVPGIVTGTGLSTGNIEFWPSNYSTNNDVGVPNASSGVYDWGDGGANNSVGYGSMQIANYGSSQMLFSFNDWNSGTPDLGIGNQSTGNPDWTFAGNAGSYTVKNLDILVEIATPEPATALYLGSGLLMAAFIRGRIRCTPDATTAERQRKS